jgi:hypothetical protein
MPEHILLLWRQGALFDLREAFHIYLTPGPSPDDAFCAERNKIEERRQERGAAIPPLLIRRFYESGEGVRGVRHLPILSR